MTNNKNKHVWRRYGLLTSLACSVAAAGPIPDPTHTARVVPGSQNMSRGDFEDGSISSHRYLSSWNGWRFGPNTGIVREARAFAAGQNFASGSYGLFLQRGDSTAETNTNLSEGAWQISFNGSQRLRGGSYERQIVRVFVDDREVFEQRLFGIGFRRYFSKSFTHSGGRISVRLEGINGSGDHSAIIDRIRFERVGLWKDSATWAGGRIPNSINNNIRIPSGVRVALNEDDQNIRAGHVHLQGELGVISQGGGRTEFVCRSVLVDGGQARFLVGTDQSPHPGRFDISLIGSNRSFDIEGFGNKFIGARNGGLLSLHGRDVTNFVELADSIDAGATTLITRTRPRGWRVGNNIVINTSRGTVGGARAWAQNEQRRIVSIQNISNGRTEIEIDRGVGHPHLSETYSTRDNVSPTRNWNYDIRTTIALLDRGITITGENPGNAGFGGHVMIMGEINGNSRAGIGRVEDVRFTQMGQRGLIGRYPFHWHMLADAGRFQYIENCTIDDSFNRAITIHGTHNTRVIDNFAYKHLGHGVFLEDGGEEDNIISRNLIALSNKPANGQEILSTDNQLNSVVNRSPSAFWIANPKNTIDDNIVAGTEGVGYWFALNDRPTGLAASDSRLRNLNPRTNPVTSFENNVAHSSNLGLDINDAVEDDTLDIRSNVPYKPSQTPQFFDGTKVYGCRIGLYAGLGTNEGELIYENHELIANATATVFASYQNVQDSLFVSDTSDNLISGNNNAVRLYDGPARFLNCHFERFNQSSSSLFSQGGGAVNRTNWMFEGSSFSHSGAPRIAMGTTNSAFQMDSVIDVDGTITGIPQSSIVTNHPIMRTSSDPSSPSNWRNTHISQNEFASMQINFNRGGNNAFPSLDFIRTSSSDSSDRVSINLDHSVIPFRVFCPIINSDFRYQVNFPDGRPSGRRMLFRFRDCFNGDEVEFRISQIGNLNGRVTNIPEASSLGNMRSRNSSSYFRQGANVFFKFVRDANGVEDQQSIDIRWD